MCVNYYFRVRGRVDGQHGASARESLQSSLSGLWRVITVLAAVSEGHIRTDDLDLTHNFSLHATCMSCALGSDGRCC